MCWLNPTCRIILTIGLLFVFNSGFPQNTIVDSLLNVVENNQANAETYNQLAYEHWYIDIKKSKEYALKALELAHAEENEAQVGFAFNRLGTAYMYLQQPDSAKIYYDKSADVFEKLAMYTELAGATACCARIFESKLEYDSAIYKYKQALEIFEESQKSEYYAQTLMVVGGLHSKRGDFKSAQVYFDMALDKISYLKPYDVISLYNKIGINFQNLGDFSNAIKFFEQAFTTCDLSDNNIALAGTYVNVANLYVAWGKHIEAIKFLEKGIEISKSSGFETHTQGILIMLGEIYFTLGEIDKAKSYYSNLLDNKNIAVDDLNLGKAYLGLAKIYKSELDYKKAKVSAQNALPLFENTQRPLLIANNYNLIAEICMVLNEFDQAKFYLNLATDIADRNSLKELQMHNALLWARYTNYVNRGVGSHEYYENYIQLKDSLFAKQNQELFAKFRVELGNLEKDFQLKEAQNQNLLKDVEIKNKRSQIVYAIASSLLLFIGIIVFAIMYISKQRANRVLFIKNKELLQKNEMPQHRSESIAIPELLQNEILQKLNHEINENKIHLDSNLSLYSLSKIIGTNSTYLSKIIQSNYNSNFSSYLNSVRIIEAQKMILNPEFSNYTIDAISQECGYNSKSTFNKAFKQITGLTPNEYKRQENLSE